MMLKQMLVLTVLAALVAHAESYGFTLDHRDKTMISLMDERLKKNGMDSDATNEQIYGIFKKMNAVGDISAQMELVSFIAAGSILVDQAKIDCTEGKLNGINMMQAALKRNPSRVSAPLRRYIAEASSKVTSECLEQLSANDWKVFDDQLNSEHVEVLEKVLGSSFDHPDKIDGDNFWIEYEAREQAAYPDGPAVDVRGGTSGHYRVEEAVESALVLMKNLGEPLPFDKFNHKLQMLYTAYLILENLKADNEVLDNLANKYPEIFSELTADSSALSRIFARHHNATVVATCAKLGLKKKTLSLAKTNLTYAKAWRGVAMARICYDAMANQES